MGDSRFTEIAELLACRSETILFEPYSTRGYMLSNIKQRFCELLASIK